MTDKGKEIGTTLGYGVLTAALYFLLFSYDEQVLSLSGRGGWACALPVAIAFAISFAHGSFTSRFWDFFDIKAKK